jgi:2-dehydropantoate 2-reductase
MTRIAFMGAGAAACYIGAFLTRKGEDTTFIDPWPEHVEKMRTVGLRASGSQGDFTVPVKAMHLTEVQAVREPFDIAFIAVKSYDTEWATHFIKRYLKPAGYVVSSQNCMNDELIASIVGYHREVPCVMSRIEVALWEPAHVNRGGPVGRDHGHDVFRVGETNGRITPRVEYLVDLLSCIDGARATTNIWGERWAKLTQNSMGNPVGAISGLGAEGMAANSRARALRIHIAKEAAQVGLALNYKVEKVAGFEAGVWAKADQGDVYEELEASLMPKPGRVDWHSSMAQDVKKGRLSEIDYMNGYVVRKGQEAAVATPVNAAIVEMMHEIDAGRTKQTPANMERVLRSAGVS